VASVGSMGGSFAGGSVGSATRRRTASAGDADDETIRERFREVYRRIWSNPSVAAVLSSAPQLWLLSEGCKVISNAQIKNALAT